MFRDCPAGGGWSGPSDPGFTPRDVLDCDEAVNALPLVLRVVVISHYQRCGSLRGTAKDCGINHRTTSQYLGQAHGLIESSMREPATA